MEKDWLGHEIRDVSYFLRGTEYPFPFTKAYVAVWWNDNINFSTEEWEENSKDCLKTQKDGIEYAIDNSHCAIHIEGPPLDLHTIQEWFNSKFFGRNPPAFAWIDSLVEILLRLLGSMITQTIFRKKADSSWIGLVRWKIS